MESTPKNMKKHERLTVFRGRGDVDKYISILQDLPKLFGAGILSSLRYTMGDYLKSTEGTLRNELRPVPFLFLNYAFVVRPSCLTFFNSCPKDMEKRDSEENVST
jgi:hypothetical protein